jgi:amino acid transporter
MTIFAVIIWILVILGTLGYAEEEFWSSCLKLFVVVLFIFIGIVCICGGGPAGGDYDSYLGGAYWQNPGAFANGFKGVCAVFVTAAFSFAGTELVGLAASETPNPRTALPGAVKQTSTSLPLPSSVLRSPTTTPDSLMEVVPRSLHSSFSWRRLGLEVSTT